MKFTSKKDINARFDEDLRERPAQLLALFVLAIFIVFTGLNLLPQDNQTARFSTSFWYGCAVSILCFVGLVGVKIREDRNRFSHRVRRSIHIMMLCIGVSVVLSSVVGILFLSTPSSLLIVAGITLTQLPRIIRVL